MEILKSERYINEKLNIKPVSKDRLDSFLKEPEVDDKTKRFIKDNNLVWNPLTKCYDCDGDIEISKDIVFDGKLKIRFGHVKGYFYCSSNELTTLEGAPQEVGFNFDCSYNKLTTLKGAPQKVSGDFYCSVNKLTTLECAPQKVGGNLYCSSNELTTLEGAPQEVGGNFVCSYNELTNLEGAPQKVGGNFVCGYNKLKTLEGAPQKVGGNFICKNNRYKNIFPNEKPSWIKGEFITK